MKKSLLAATLASVAALAAVGGAGLASASSSVVPHSAAYTWSGTDNGTCQNAWAQDLGTRVFTQPAADPAGNYTIVENFTNGHFSTFAGMSPGACNGPAGGGQFATPPGNGHTLSEGLQGTFTGNEHLFIIGAGTFSAAGAGADFSCAGVVSGVPNACTTRSYVNYHYSTGSAATIDTTSYLFNYKTSSILAKGTKKFSEKSALNNTTEADAGDIYTGP
jgi:hypothetical protein